MRSRGVFVSCFFAAALFSGCLLSGARPLAAVSEPSSLEAERSFIRDLVRTTVSVSVVLRSGATKKPYGGAGVLLDWSGHILTNDHILVGPDAYTTSASAPHVEASIAFCDLGKDDLPHCTGAYRAAVIRRDPFPRGADLALLRLCNEATPPLTARLTEFAKAVPVIGEVLWRVGRDPVPIVMGYYLESLLGLKEFRIGFPVAPGASGGPIFNASAQVVALTRAHEPNRHWRLPVARVIPSSYIEEWLKSALSISKPCTAR